MKEFLQKNGVWVVVGVVVVAALLWWSGLVKGWPGSTAAEPATTSTYIETPALTPAVSKAYEDSESNISTMSFSSNPQKSSIFYF